MSDARLDWRDDRLWLAGPVNMTTAGQLATTIPAAIAGASGEEVVLDCAAMTGSDSSAIALWLDIERNLASRGKTLKVTGLRPQLERLAAIYGVDWLLS